MVRTFEDILIKGAVNAAAIYLYYYKYNYKVSFVNLAIYFSNNYLSITR